MRVVLFIALFLFARAAAGQSSFLKDAAAKLEKALAAKDTVVLKQLLHRDLSYGHSNGWIETREEVIRHLVTKKLEYEKIESGAQVWTVKKDLALLRTPSWISYVLDGKPGTLSLHVLQVWVKTNNGWQLIARQSTKIN